MRFSKSLFVLIPLIQLLLTACTGGGGDDDHSGSSGGSVTLRANVVLLGPVSGSEDVIDALDTAINTMRTTYSREADINLDIITSSYDGPEDAPLPGDVFYQGLVTSQRPNAINIVIASDRKGSSTDEFEFGTLGATPFSTTPNADSVIVISIQDVAGSNGIFDNKQHNDEKRLLGEEMGRFTAKALGLPNIVDIDGSRIVGSDNIADTPSCISKEACRDDSSVRTNLMYPEPLEKERDDLSEQNREFYPRDQLTAQQSQVLRASQFVR